MPACPATIGSPSGSAASSAPAPTSAPSATFGVAFAGSSYRCSMSSKCTTCFSTFSNRTLPGIAARMVSPSGPVASSAPAPTSVPLFRTCSSVPTGSACRLTMRIAGWFSSGASMMMRSVRPVTSSNFSSKVTPFSISSKCTVPGCSVRIERV